MTKRQKAKKAYLKGSFGKYPDRPCVEVGFRAEEVLMRDSRDPAGLVLRFSIEEWNAFVAGVKNGDFDLSV